MVTTSDNKEIRNRIGRHEVRPAEVLSIRAFLSLDGSDGMSENIAGMKKTTQLARLLARVKQPEDGWTFSELALAFYGQTKDWNNMRKLEHNNELVQWTPSWPQGNSTNSLIHNFRKKLMKGKGDAYYSYPTSMPDFSGKVMNILIPIESIDRFEKTIVSLRKKRDGIDKTIEKLNEIKKIPRKQRQKNTERAIREMSEETRKKRK